MERKNNKTSVASRYKATKQAQRSQSLQRNAVKQNPQIAAPVAYSQKQEFPNRTRMTSRRIRNSEFVASINGSVAFDASQKYVINPGLVGTFPWLSIQAAEWQQYRIHSMDFRYVTRTSTSSVGSVILSPDYNAVDSPPTSETIASNTQDSVEDVCWRSITCKLDPAAMFPLGPRKQIRIGNISGDYTTYDAGRFYVCTKGQSSAAEIGKLWVDYDIELFVPQSSPAQSPTSTATTAFFESSANQSMTTAVQSTIVYDTAVNNGLSILNSSGVFTPPAGNYYAVLQTLISSTNTGTMARAYVLFKNGVSSYVYPSISQNYAAGGTAVFCDSITLYISANGTDTFEFKLTVTSAGTLILPAKTSVRWALA